MRFLLAIFFLVSPAFAAKDAIDFKADYYQRDLSTNTVRGKGNAWVKHGERELWADEVEIDLSTNRVIARGNVHLKDGPLEIWCSYANYDMSGNDGVMEDAVISTAQVVLAGSAIKKLSAITFEIDHGSYSNCNVDLIPIKNISSCDFDWKVYGSRLSVTLGAYGSVKDAVFYFKGLPMTYFPYIVFPVKTQRQTGLLMPTMTFIGNLGSGFSIPVFFALDSWHDLTVTPTLFLKKEINQLFVKSEYRYAYSHDTKGYLNYSFSNKRFSTNRSSPGTPDPTRAKFLGVVGEWALDMHNEYSFTGRGRARQTFHLASDPYWLVEYGGLPDDAGFGYLRSLVNYSLPSDHLFFGAQVAHHQSLIMPEDDGADGGAVTRLPEIFFSKANTNLLGKVLTYEVNTRLTNYSRGGLGFDQIPDSPQPVGNTGDNPQFDGNDYIRTGQRLIVEPAIVANVPLTTGLQFNPSLRAGSILYHFNDPRSAFLSREYADIEIPFSIYLSRKFESGLSGFEKVSHVLQPRVVYASNIYHDEEENSAAFQAQNPFFFQTSSLSNPRFDINDTVTPFQYFRFELINRFRRMTPKGSERFFFLKLSEQYNLKTFSYDARYSRAIGPIEILSEVSLGNLSAQLQASYQLETNQGVRENDWSGSIVYRSAEGDNLSTSLLFRKRFDHAITEESVRFQGYKVLPTFFDLSGNFEYSAKRGEIVSYGIGFTFASKPRSCWRIEVQTGRDALRRPFANFQFNLNFGGPRGTL